MHEETMSGSAGHAAVKRDGASEGLEANRRPQMRPASQLPSTTRTSLESQEAVAAGVLLP